MAVSAVLAKNYRKIERKTASDFPPAKTLNVAENQNKNLMQLIITYLLQWRNLGGFRLFRGSVKREVGRLFLAIQYLRQAQFLLRNRNILQGTHFRFFHGSFSNFGEEGCIFVFSNS